MYIICFYSYGDNRSGHRFHTSEFSAYNHDGLNIEHPRFPQEAIPRGVHGVNIHQNYPYYYYYSSMATDPNQSMPPHPHHNMPPNIYSSIPSHHVCLCIYFTFTPTDSTYVVPHCPHIPPLAYLHTSYSRLTFYMFSPHSKNNISEYRRKRHIQLT